MTLKENQIKTTTTENTSISLRCSNALLFRVTRCNWAQHAYTFNHYIRRDLGRCTSAWKGLKSSLKINSLYYTMIKVRSALPSHVSGHPTFVHLVLALTKLPQHHFIFQTQVGFRTALSSNHLNSQLRLQRAGVTLEGYFPACGRKVFLFALTVSWWMPW